MFPSMWRRLVNPSAANAPRPPTCRPSLESLEDRVTPATFLVTNSSDNLLPGSLRYAISQGNLDPGSTILITRQVTTPIKLTRGELAIQANVTIQNDAGAPVTIHQRTRDARVFHVSGSGALAVTITGGNASAPLIITGGSIRGANGGGILVDTANSTLTLNHVQIAGNRALQTGAPNDPTGGIGGGIYSAGSVTLQGSAVVGNRADTGGGGVGVNAGAVTLTQGSIVGGNRSRRGEGGGISVATGSVSLGGGSHVDGNSARDVGGIMVGTTVAAADTAVSVTGGSTVNGNSSTAGQRQNPNNLGGGGIAVVALGNVTIDGSQVNGNSTVGMYSGGIVVGLGSVTVANGSQINGNRNNGPGGGVAANFGGKVSVSGRSEVNFNTGGALGGGIVNFAGPFGAVEVSGGSQVSHNTLTNGETVGRVIAVFLAVADPNSGLQAFAAATGGSGGAAMRRGLDRVGHAARRTARFLKHTLGNVSHPLGVLVAGGGIAAFAAPVSITGGSQVNGNLSGKNVLGRHHRVIGLGGGIFQLAGQVTIDQSRIDDNQAPRGDGGGIWSGGVLNVLSSTVSGNTAAGEGGGLFNASRGQATAQSTTFQGNRASFGGGMATAGNLTVLQSIVAANVAAQQGGGIFTNGGTLTQDGVVFVGNSPDNVAGG
jgi:fibronectin-binding autotransporter adhesin